MTMPLLVNAVLKDDHATVRADCTKAGGEPRSPTVSCDQVKSGLPPACYRLQLKSRMMGIYKLLKTALLLRIFFATLGKIDEISRYWIQMLIGLYSALLISVTLNKRG